MLKRRVTLYLIRHGETDWNVVRRYQGQTDTPLNDKGRAQAARNGRALARHLGARAAQLAYVSSPLQRSAETMAIVRREIGLEPHAFACDDRLKEINFGHWEGRIWDDLPLEDPEGFAARQRDPFHWRPRGGESYADLAERVATWLAEVERDTVCVTHGGVSRVIRGHLLSLEWAKIHMLDAPQNVVMVLRDGTIDTL